MTLALLIGLLALAGQWSSYRVSTQVLEAAVRQREIDKVDSVGRVVQSEIEAHGNKAKLVTQLLQVDSAVAELMARHGPDRGAQLALKLDQAFQVGGVQVLELTDRDERVVYRAQHPARLGEQATGWGVAEALSGAATLVSSRSARGVDVSYVAPLRFGGAVVGSISAGVALDQEFVDRVGRAVGAKLVLLARNGAALAGKVEAARSVDDTALTEAFQNKLPVYRSDTAAHRTSVYLPLSVVDDGYVMLAQIDSADAFALIADGRRRSAIYATLIFAVSIFIGLLVLRLLLRPLRLLRRRAEQTALELTGQAITVRGSDEVGSVVKVLDTLTGRLLQRNNELLVAKSQAEAANSAKSQFLSTMSHEIRTPLNGVLGMTELLQHSRLDAEQSRFVHVIATAGRALHDLLGDILDLARIDAGKVRLEQVDFDLATVLSDISDIYRELASARGLLLVSDLPAMGARVNGDPGRLRQVLSNLLGNAVKFTEHGTVRLHCEQLPAPAGDTRSWRRLSVEDTGMGIAPEALDKLFQRFTQADDSTTRKFGGSGLGLVISRHLVELMGGSIHVHSVPGQGARFWIDLPFDPAKAPYAPALAAPKVLHHAACRILVAEDNLVNQQVIKGLLGHLGVVVTVVDNGELAQECFRQGRFDLVFMDCQMPVMDGFEATRRIRAWEQDQPARSPVPIVALTANALSGDREACLAAGMTDYLAKPITMASLARTLARHLAQAVPLVDPPWSATAGGAPGAAVAAFDPSVVDGLPMVADGSDPGFADQILGMFADGTRTAFEAMDEAFRAGDATELLRALHTIKSSAAQVGAMALSAAAARLEGLLRAGATMQADGAWQLRQEMDRFERALGQHRQAQVSPQEAVE